jgi:prepilin-type N-terminal cleavage/methylation domain-containing protein
MSRRAPGFTLLEVAVALAILGVGIVTCLRIFSGSLRLEDRATRETRAVLHARATMDSLVFQPEDQIASCNREWTTAEGYQTRTQCRYAGPADGVEDTEFTDTADLRLYYLQVDVGWQDGQGAKSYTLSSMRMAPPYD